MPKWRKATWALVIWTFLIALWIGAGVMNVSDSCTGRTGNELETCQAATAIGGGIGVTFIVVIWFIGFVVLGLVWLMSRPKENVLVFGPQGQQVTVSEKEAQRRIETGWTYRAETEAAFNARGSSGEAPQGLPAFEQAKLELARTGKRRIFECSRCGKGLSLGWTRCDHCKATFDDFPPRDTGQAV